MRFRPLPLADAWTVDVEPFEDERGSFARVFCAEELRRHGAVGEVAQINLSSNAEAGTLRGLHYQLAPAEAKLLRCVRGAVFDVMVDMRPSSPTYLQWYGAELSEHNLRAVFVPPLFAHGYQALTAGATVIYTTSSPYAPGAERGLRWDDPTLAIDWPIADPVLSPKDTAWPLLPSRAALPVP